MPRQILKSAGTHAQLRAQIGEGRAVGSPCVARTRRHSYLQKMSALDAGIVEAGPDLDQLLAQIRAELGELGLPELPIGWLSRCHLGIPYEVHALDEAGRILRHFKMGEALDSRFERARPLACHAAYAFIEIYESKLVCVRDDGTTTSV